MTKATYDSAKGNRDRVDAPTSADRGHARGDAHADQQDGQDDQDDQDDLPLPPPPAVIGRVIGGNFRVLKLIGTGAMGHVFQAEQLSLGKMVALKLLRNELQADEKLIKRFALEAKNASSLNHPNSIQIIDFGRDGDLLFIAMELLPGVDLGQLILREGPLPLQRLGRIMDQVLAALDEAHAQGIVHRDLKPGNIMLVSRRDDPDFVKVCDFGIAKAQASTEGAGLTIKGLVCGTPEYMSPEQARGEEVDGRSDLYAVGVILYQLVTGELPFSASSPVGILSKHLAEPPVPPSVKHPGLMIPPALEAVILHALAKDPADRPRSAERLRRALRSALADLPELATTPGTGHRPVGSSDTLNARPTTPIALAARPPTDRLHGLQTGTNPARRGRWMLGAALLLSIGLGGWFVVTGRPAQAPATTPASAGVVAKSPPASQPPPSSLGTLAPTPSQVDPLPPPAPAPEVSAPIPGPEIAAESAASESPHRRDRRPSKSGSGAPKTAPRMAVEGSSRSRAAESSAVLPLGAAAKGSGLAPTSGEPPLDDPFAQAAAPALSTARPSTHPGPLDAMKEAEALLGQGDVLRACSKGEEQRQNTPAVAQVYKFLGKCYMRAGKPDKAMANYRRYLELAPDAADAAFIRSIVR